MGKTSKRNLGKWSAVCRLVDFMERIGIKPEPESSSATIESMAKLRAFFDKFYGRNNE